MAGRTRQTDIVPDEVVDLDIEDCPYCGGNMKIIAVIEEPSVIAKILAHLGLPAGHLRCAISASLAVQSVRSILAFTPPIPALTIPGFLSIRNSLSPNQRRLQSGSVLIRASSLAFAVANC